MSFKLISSIIFLGTLCTAIPAMADNARTSTDWSGQYIGIAVGSSYQKTDPNVDALLTDYFSPPDDVQLDPINSKDLSENELAGSLFWGINRQLENLVYGFELDVNIADFDEQHSVDDISYISAPGQSFSVSTDVSSDWSVSLRPRIGYVWKKTLFFVTGGLAVTRFRYDFNYADKPVNDGTASLDESKTALGITAGFGVEHKLEDGWAIRTEYAYANYNDIVDKKSAIVGWGEGFKHEIDHETHNLRIGISKYF